ncbi:MULTISPECIES: phosphatase PAP2 family protein [unclassified Bosea (in: a-proteobacteria)]|uniref:acid phosphatase n=1 Tax=unclassified Bosea (in: a-proteobacteria) TaxID=2653178 RepID=UPI001F2C5D2D|nr:MULTISPECIES: phosphatase PAP2 family protein [unclassified Bosea (in: a-proteobacteria)]
MTGTTVRAAGASVLMLLAICGQAFAQSAEVPPKVTDPHFKIAPGYLKQSDLPNSLVLLGPPPEAGSAALARDEEARKATLPLRNTARWKLAHADADLAFPQAADNFSCAMGVKIDSKRTPRLYAMTQKMLSDFGLSTYGVKNKYNRVRPFVVHNEATCRADQEAILRSDGSYPSGHTAAGWGWALVFAQINPERADALLKRGLEFGQSRVICDAHWQSDVDAGRIMGAATVARLQTDPIFLADLKAAKAEVKAAKAKRMLPASECAAETAALSAR